MKTFGAAFSTVSTIFFMLAGLAGVCLTAVGWEPPLRLLAFVAFTALAAAFAAHLAVWGLRR